jgi:hypothetical protein
MAYKLIDASLDTALSLLHRVCVIAQLLIKRYSMVSPLFRALNND